MVDCEATRTFYLCKRMNEGNTSINGLIHEIRKYKFGLMLYTEKQVFIKHFNLILIRYQMKLRFLSFSKHGNTYIFTKFNEEFYDNDIRLVCIYFETL
jgi:hypothetical protein